MEEEIDISQTEGYFDETDRFFTEEMTPEDFKKELEKNSLTTKGWLNNFPLKIYDLNYRLDSIQEVVPDLKEMINEIDKTYEEGIYSMDYEYFKRHLQTMWNEEVELTIIDLYIKMLRKGYSRYSENGISLTS